MNLTQKAIFNGSREQSGIWDVITDLCTLSNIKREDAFRKIQGETDFVLTRDDIFFVKSPRLYESLGSFTLDPSFIKRLDLKDVEFNQSGPFYYFSNVPSI